MDLKGSSVTDLLHLKKCNFWNVKMIIFNQKAEKNLYLVYLAFLAENSNFFLLLKSAICDVTILRDFTTLEVKEGFFSGLEHMLRLNEMLSSQAKYFDARQDFLPLCFRTMSNNSATWKDLQWKLNSKGNLITVWKWHTTKNLPSSSGLLY